MSMARKALDLLFGRDVLGRCSSCLSRVRRDELHECDPAAVVHGNSWRTLKLSEIDIHLPPGKYTQQELLGKIQRQRAADLAAKAKSIADDVDHVCGHVGGMGSLSLAVMLLSEAVEALTLGGEATGAQPAEGATLNRHPSVQTDASHTTAPRSGASEGGS